MTGAAGYMALVLAEAVAGSLAFLWLTPLWNEVKRGFFTLTTAILLVLAVGAVALDPRRVDPGRRCGPMVRGADARDRGRDRAHVPADAREAASAGAHPRRAERRCSRSPPSSRWRAPGASRSRSPLFQLLAGAAFLGSITVGLLLGHWYLTDRGLGRGPIDRLTTAMLVAVVVEAIAIVTSGFGGVESSASLNPLLTAGALAPWIALGMVVATLLIALLTRATLKGERASAVQSATGFYYLAVVTAFTAEVAVKTRFLA